MIRPEAVSFYAAKVFHARVRPHAHRFTYRVLAMVIDIDRLAEAGKVSRLFSVGRFNLLSFCAGDHGPRDGTDLRVHIDGLLHAAGLDTPPAKVLLQCLPRIAGFGFNPLATYYCLDGSGDLAALVYEVRNTFGEHHSYILKAADEAGRCAHHEADKLFYVSPFMDMPLRYRFRAELPGNRLSLKIIERDREGVVLTALLSGTVIANSGWPLLRHALASPLLGFKVVAGIHWEALRLWLKGHFVRKRPLPPPPASFGTPGAFSDTPQPLQRNHP